jgi:hypothetical protein
VLLGIGVWPAAAYVAWRAWRLERPGDRLLASSLVIFGGLLVLLDQTKTPLYAILLLPSVCMALAILGTGVVGWVGRRWPRVWPRSLVVAALAGLLVAVGAEGVGAYQLALMQSTQAGHYLEVGQHIETALPASARVLGPERWWWALHAYPYTSVRNLWFQWTAAARSGESPNFAEWVIRIQADHVLVNDNVRGDVRAFPERLQQQFWTFIETCTTQVLDLDDPTYLRIEVYAIVTRPDCRV